MLSTAPQKGHTMVGVNLTNVHLMSGCLTGVRLTGVYLIRTHFIGVCLMGTLYGHASHGQVPHKRASHACVS
jgi:uncharacterized protein YjbI with pentapeptide repeats